MKRYISIVLLLSFVCPLHAQTDVKQENSYYSVDYESGDADGQEECSEDSELSLLRRPSYGRVEVSWQVPSQPLWFDTEEDSTQVPTGEEKDESRGKKRLLTACCIGGTFVALLCLIWFAQFAQWLATH